MLYSDSTTSDFANKIYLKMPYVKKMTTKQNEENQVKRDILRLLPRSCAAMSRMASTYHSAWLILGSDPKVFSSKAIILCHSIELQNKNVNVMLCLLLKFTNSMNS